MKPPAIRICTTCRIPERYKGGDCQGSLNKGVNQAKGSLNKILNISAGGDQHPVRRLASIALGRLTLPKSNRS
jgi:hypothetical protein